MAFENLQELVSFLEGSGQLARIQESLSPHLEISEVSDRAVKQNGPALLFRKSHRPQISGADQRLRLS